MAIVKIGVGCNVGAQVDGTQHAAQVAATWIKKPDVMIVQNRQLGEDDHYLYVIKDVITQVQTHVKQSIDNDRFPLVIGGDHSIVMGSLPYKEDTLVVWIDAHPDLNTFETSLTNHIHGMPLAHLLGHGDSRLLDVIAKPVLSDDQVVLLGIRDIDKKEQEFIDQHKLRVIDVKQSNDSIIKELLDYAKNYKNIHISFDIDSIDPEYAPGVSTPVADGISVSLALDLLHGLFSTDKVISMDIVEFNPLVETRSTVNVLKQLVSVVEHYND